MVLKTKLHALQSYKLLITFVACLLVFAGGRWFERQIENSNFNGSYHGAYLMVGQSAEIKASLLFDKSTHTALLHLSLWYKTIERQEDVYIEFDTNALEYRTLFKSKVTYLISLDNQNPDRHFTKIIPMAIRHLKNEIILIIDDKGLFNITDGDMRSVDSKMVFIMKKI